MQNYKPDNIRNIVLLGHQGSGKTTFVESMLHISGVVSKPGMVENGSTKSDFTKEEKKHQFSISTSVIPIEWEGYKYNFLDAPGLLDFVGEINSALRVARAAIIMVDASSGVEVGTEKAWEYVRRRSLPSIVFVNKMDKENINFDKVLEEIREKLGKRAVPFCIPIGREKDFEGFVNVVDMNARIYNGKECVDAEIWEEKMDKVNKLHEMIVESVAETSEELMEKYFDGEEFTTEEIHEGLFNGILSGELVPVIVGSATKNVGTHTLLNMIKTYMPSPLDMRQPFGEIPGEIDIVERKISLEDPFSAIVFKTVFDPFIGRISYIKVRSGSLKRDQLVLNSTKGVKEKAGHIFYIRGNEQIDAKELTAGDIGIITKMDNIETGDTICDPKHVIKYREIPNPSATLFYGVVPKSKKDEEKISDALHRLEAESLTFEMKRNYETHQLLIGGQGQLHIDVMVEKLKNIYDVDVTLEEPRVVYRETIRGKSDVQGKYKKQSGGSGQYGDVKIRFEPCEEDFVFEEEIFGGSVPKNYIPAVEKGLVESLKTGVLAGFPVIGLKAVLYDGSYHSVDSSELAFKMAASIAFKDGCKKAKPTLLEPIMNVEIVVTDDYVGDILGDLNKHRGRVLGIDPNGTHQVIHAEVPQVEMLKYTINLKTLTQDRGTFSMEFLRYEDMPIHLAEKVINEAKSDK